MEIDYSEYCVLGMHIPLNVIEMDISWTTSCVFFSIDGKCGRTV